MHWAPYRILTMKTNTIKWAYHLKTVNKPICIHKLYFQLLCSYRFTLSFSPSVFSLRIDCMNVLVCVCLGCIRPDNDKWTIFSTVACDMRRLRQLRVEIHFYLFLCSFMHLVDRMARAACLNSSTAMRLDYEIRFICVTCWTLSIEHIHTHLKFTQNL